jgi:hypothetical protein
MKKIIVVLLSFYLLSYACTKDKIIPDVTHNGTSNNNSINYSKEFLDSCAVLNVSYSNDIEPIFVYNCCACHVWCANGTMTKVLLTEKTMPPSYAYGPKFLTNEELQKISCWIADGYPNN